MLKLWPKRVETNDAALYAILLIMVPIAIVIFMIMAISHNAFDANIMVGCYAYNNVKSIKVTPQEILFVNGENFSTPAILTHTNSGYTIMPKTGFGVRVSNGHLVPVRSDDLGYIFIENPTGKTDMKIGAIPDGSTVLYKASC